MELADMQVSKTCGLNTHVGSTPTSGIIQRVIMSDRRNLAYVIGVAIGDGNLSNPNGRAVRLRITCDTRYPKLLDRLTQAIQKLLPENKVSLIKRTKRCVDISCYSNRWEKWLGWEAGKGSKFHQNVSIPSWIFRQKSFAAACLKGLLETDGSIYRDRQYPMINFVTTIPRLANDVVILFRSIGFQPHLYKLIRTTKTKYTIRLSKDTERLVKLIRLSKD